MASRYQRYAGGDPLAAPVDLSEALEAIGQDVMAGHAPERAMREFLRRGSEQTPGLDDLARRIAQKRQELLRRHDLEATMARVKELLDDAVLAERQRLARDLDDDARFQEMRLQNLPDSPAAAVTELTDYGWRDQGAREAYEQIQDLLGRELLDQRFAGMKQALQDATDEDRERVGRMIADLNRLLEKRRLGEDTPEDFAAFMAEHGDFFPERPRDLDALMDGLAQRAAAAQRMLNSMSAEQREELMSLSQQAFGSPELNRALGELDQHLQSLRPGEDWSGGQPVDDVMAELADLDALFDQLQQSYAGARMDDVDLDKLARHLGQDAAVDARTLQDLERTLRETGYLSKGSDGRLRLSPKAMRQLGKSLLRDVAQRLSGREGQRENRQAGAAGELTGATREWAFGDTEPWEVGRTITNAVRRTAGGRRGSAVRLEIGDVEVQETEARTQAAVALLVDTSFSMAMDGRWVPMKQTALALHQLIGSRFRGDELELIAFGRHAQVMRIEELTALDAQWTKGTNLHHGLLLANRFFRRHPHAQPVLLVVTDGEPTSHLLPDGEVFFEYPPHPLTIASAVRELDNARRLGAHTTFFKLGEDPGLARFIDSMARRVEGRVVAPESEALGSAVVGSYLGGRGGRGAWAG